MKQIVPTSGKEDDDEEEEEGIEAHTELDENDVLHRKYSLVRFKSQDTYARGALVPASEELERMRPTDGGEMDHTNIYMSLRIRKVRRIDAKSSSVSIAATIALQWRVSQMHEKHSCRAENLWTPKISILNADDLSLSTDVPTYFPKQKSARQIVHINGTVSVSLDHSYFPFDFDYIGI